MSVQTNVEQVKNEQKLLIPIMHCFDNNYVIPAAVSFYSMLENASKKYSYQLYVLHTDITVQNQAALQQVVSQFENASLEFIDMQNRFEDLWQQLCFSGHFSKEVLYKLLIPSIFPQYDKIIVTDVDVAFLGDISESYFALNTKQSFYFAGVRQIMPKNTWLESYYKNYEEHFGPQSIDQLKICGGYLIANLDALRKDHMEEKFVAFLKENAYRLLQSEQDVINFCCEADQVVYLPLANVTCSYMYELFNTEESLCSDPTYTAQELQEAMEHPIQLHYATGTKPWNAPISTKSDIWYYYLAQSGMYYDFMKKQEALSEPDPVRIPCWEVWKGEHENRSPMIVSVLCCTYNHSEFIREALDGILMQKTNFPFELIVSDDASTDDTQEIILEYQQRYPQIMKKCILRKENVGIGKNYYEALTQVSGQYLALCDGDDKWLDPYKLQHQVDFLSKHRGYTVCCSSFQQHVVNDPNVEDSIFRVEEYIGSAMPLKSGYNFRDLLNCRFVASCTVMFRWQLRNRVPEFLKSYKTIDFPLTLIHAAVGQIKVMNDCVFSQYNVHSGGVTSQTQIYNMEQETLCVINEVNQLLNYRFHRSVTEFFAEYKRSKMQATKAVVEIPEIVQDPALPQEQVHSPIKHRLGVLYRDYVPNVIKRLYRLIKRTPRILYEELVPEVIKRFYRKIRIGLRNKMS